MELRIVPSFVGKIGGAVSAGCSQKLLFIPKKFMWPTTSSQFIKLSSNLGSNIAFLTMLQDKSLQSEALLALEPSHLQTNLSAFGWLTAVNVGGQTSPLELH